MDLGLTGKVALVTGSSKGIGRAIAARLAREGCQVVLCSRGEDALKAAADTIEAATGSRPYYRTCDLTRTDDVCELVADVQDRFGRIDLLVANSGGPKRGNFLDYDDEAWREAFEASALATIRLIREVLPHMERLGSGSILTITSSSVKQPITGHWLSNVMRPGVLGLVKTLALDLAPKGIRVNNIAPGRIITERVRTTDERAAREKGVTVEEAQKGQLQRVPMGRFGAPDEIADAAAFLLSERASYITGNTLHVDGGMVRSL